ncbi:MAG: hypothetical protein K2K70_05580, partial [Lachnospiraceae bacterium]|nr:hypothetical protein [Lachnospiraceae bacterium]
FKKCGKWIGMAAVGLVIAAGVVCLTDAKEKDANTTDVIASQEEEKNEEKDGEVQDSVEEVSNDMVRYISVISVDEIWDTKQEPEYSLMKYIVENMPPEVEKELRKNGVWHVSYGDNRTLQYNLANGGGNNGTNNITLSLDFTYRGNQLLQYTVQDYGFMDKVEPSKERPWFAQLVSFAGDCAGVESKYIDDPIDELSDKEIDSFEYNVIGFADSSDRLIDGTYRYYKDTEGSTYLYDERIDMVVAYERGID